MADSQVEEMRKAYAGIMLNMAQESAARVLAAERRAAAYAGGLAAAKEDGVAALVRLKAIMEARIKEVESMHAKKIKELEDQLHGARNNVASLKDELLRANTELEQTRKTLAEERINSLPTCNKVDSNKIANACPKMHFQGGSMSLKNMKIADDSDETSLVAITAKENGTMESLENIYRCGPDLPSFMERNKKPKLYHSGCTQRIHALKQRAEGTDVSLKQNHKLTTALSSCSKIGKNNAAKNPCHKRSIMEQILQTKFRGNYKRKRGRRSRPNYKHDNSSEHGEAEYKFSDTSNENGCLLLLQAIEQDLSPPKLSDGHGEETLTDLKDDANLNRCTASPELIDALAGSNMQMQRRKRTKTIRVLEVDFSDSKSVPESANTLLRSVSEKSMSDSELISKMTENCSDTPARNNGPVLKCNQTDADNGQFESGNSPAVPLQSTKSEDINYGNLLVDQMEHRTPNNNAASWKGVNEDGITNLFSGKAGASAVSLLEKGDNLKASCALPMQVLEINDSSIRSSLNKDEHAAASSQASVQAEGARHIKYTFNRRKRKSVAVDSTPCAVPDGSDLVGLPKKQEPHPNPEAQDRLIYSPQGDSQLVQLAQQLILLSEQK